MSEFVDDLLLQCETVALQKSILPDDAEWNQIRYMGSTTTQVEEKLDSEKETLGKIYENGLYIIYEKARNAIFPEDKTGSTTYKNRAGDKFAEILDHFPELVKEGNNFLDIAGGPGAMSEVLLSKGMTGYGITLKSKTLNWYPELKDIRDFKILWGAPVKNREADGNILLPANQDYVVDHVNSVDLVVCDGGIGEDKNQELANAYLITAEIALALRTLKEGGNLVCKIYETRTDYMISLLSIISCSFDNVHIVKPVRSRAVNSERYLVCLSYIPNKAIMNYMQQFVTSAHNHNLRKELIRLPNSLIDFENKAKLDADFIKSVKKVNKSYTLRQSNAISKVLARLDLPKYDESRVQTLVPESKSNGTTKVHFEIDPQTGQYEGEIPLDVNLDTIHYLVENKILVFPYKRFHIGNPYKMFQNLVEHKGTYEFRRNLKANVYFEHPPNFGLVVPDEIKFPGKSDNDVLVIKYHRADYDNINRVTDYFTEPARMNAYVKKTRVSPAEFWLKNADWIISEMRKKNIPTTTYEVREYIYEVIDEATQFKATLSKSVYEYVSQAIFTYRKKNARQGEKVHNRIRVLDFCAGWGDRLIGALGCPLVEKMTGIDPNEDLHSGYKEATKYFRTNKNFEYNMRVEKAESMTLREDDKFELIFTSPPYFDYEIYSKHASQSIHNRNYEEWKNNFLFEAITKSFSHLVDGGYMIIHLSDFQGYHVCEDLYKFMQTKKNARFMGCMVAEANSNIPMWVWTKNDEKK